MEIMTIPDAHPAHVFSSKLLSFVVLHVDMSVAVLATLPLPFYSSSLRSEEFR